MARRTQLGPYRSGRIPREKSASQASSHGSSATRRRQRPTYPGAEATQPGDGGAAPPNDPWSPAEKEADGRYLKHEEVNVVQGMRKVRKAKKAGHASDGPTQQPENAPVDHRDLLSIEDRQPKYFVDQGVDKYKFFNNVIKEARDTKMDYASFSKIDFGEGDTAITKMLESIQDLSILATVAKGPDAGVSSERLYQRQVRRLAQAVYDTRMENMMRSVILYDRGGKPVPSDLVKSTVKSDAVSGNRTEFYHAVELDTGTVQWKEHFDLLKTLPIPEQYFETEILDLEEVSAFLKAEDNKDHFFVQIGDLQGVHDRSEIKYIKKDGTETLMELDDKLKLKINGKKPNKIFDFVIENINRVVTLDAESDGSFPYYTDDGDHITSRLDMFQKGLGGSKNLKSFQVALARIGVSHLDFDSFSIHGDIAILYKHWRVEQWAKQAEESDSDSMEEEEDENTPEKLRKKHFLKKADHFTKGAASDEEDSSDEEDEAAEKRLAKDTAAALKASNDLAASAVEKRSRSEDPAGALDADFDDASSKKSKTDSSAADAKALLEKRASITERILQTQQAAAVQAKIKQLEQLKVQRLQQLEERKRKEEEFDLQIKQLTEAVSTSDSAVGDIIEEQVETETRALRRSQIIKEMMLLAPGFAEDDPHLVALANARFRKEQREDGREDKMDIETEEFNVKKGVDNKDQVNKPGSTVNPLSKEEIELNASDELSSFWAVRPTDLVSLSTPGGSSGPAHHNQGSTFDARMDNREHTRKNNNIRVEMKYNPSKGEVCADPDDFFVKFEWAVKNADRCLWAGKLKFCLEKDDLNTILETYMEFALRDQRIKDLSSGRQEEHEYSWMKSYLLRRDKPDKITQQLSLTEQFGSILQGVKTAPHYKNVKADESVASFVNRLQRIQAKLGIESCNSGMLRMQFLVGLEVSLRKKIFYDKELSPSAPVDTLIAAAVAAWESTHKANVFEASATKHAAVVHLMAPVVNSDDESGNSGEHAGLNAMRADGQYPPDDAVLNRDNTYLANKFIEDATFDNFYSQDEVRQRHKLRANNGKASSKPHLFAKDIWFKKRVCVECKCIGHTAGSERCRSNKRKSFNNKEQRLMMAQVKKTLQKKGWTGPKRKSSKSKGNGKGAVSCG